MVACMRTWIPHHNVLISYYLLGLMPPSCVGTQLQSIHIIRGFGTAAKSEMHRITSIFFILIGLRL